MHLIVYSPNINLCLLYIRTVIQPGNTEINITSQSFKDKCIERAVGQCGTVTLPSLGKDKRLPRRDDS